MEKESPKSKLSDSKLETPGQAAESTAALLRELVAHLRQNRTQLREEWVRRIIEAKLLMAMTKEERQNIFGEFGKHAQDTGSSQVQVALLTKDIIHLTQHCQQHKKDHSTRRGLLQKVCDRRSLLTYLQKTDVNKYKELVAKLGLRR